MTINHSLWDRAVKPPADVCPQQFCFEWLEAGSWSAPGLYANLETALEATVKIENGACGCTSGRCSRIDPQSTQDCYEPHEPCLEAAGLPWFFFIPDADKLVEELRDDYIAESQALWGVKG